MIQLSMPIPTYIPISLHCYSVTASQRVGKEIIKKRKSILTHIGKNKKLILIAAKNQNQIVYLHIHSRQSKTN